MGLLDETMISSVINLEIEKIIIIFVLENKNIMEKIITYLTVNSYEYLERDTGQKCWYNKKKRG